MTRSRSGLMTALALLAPMAGHTDYHVESPYEIDLGGVVIEHNADAVFDRRPDQRGATSYTLEIGTGLTALVAHRD
jgi:hypothetical protein